MCQCVGIPYGQPYYLRVKETKLNFKIAIICIYLLNTYK